MKLLLQCFIIHINFVFNIKKLLMLMLIKINIGFNLLMSFG